LLVNIDDPEDAHRIYGLDIETDTTIDGLDPTHSPITAIGLTGATWSRVFSGPERQILAELDAALSALDDGVFVTWNGARFDLPFLADRAAIHGLDLGLVLIEDPHVRSSRDPLPGHLGGYIASWHGHRHLDAYAVYRADVGASLGLPCGLKPLARLMGHLPIEVDRTRLHDLSDERLHEYVASDAELARAMAIRRWATAVHAIDTF